jgi:ABC-type uncharacterized transport system substrate-binding protein
VRHSVGAHFSAPADVRGARSGRPKRLGLLLELTPGSAYVTVLANPKNPATDSSAKDIQAAARAIGKQLSVVYVSSNREIDTTFPTIAQKR